MATLQYDAGIRNGQLDQVESVTGTAPILRWYNGTMPANVAAALSGNTLLAEGTLPSDWMAAASAGAKGKAGTWTLTGQSGAGSGTNATFFRIYSSDGTTPRVQGDLSATGGGGAMTADNVNVANGQSITVNSFVLTAGNA